MNAHSAQPIVIPPDAGQVLAFLGVTHKLTHRHTGGGFYLFAFTFDPESGNRLHVHQHEDEIVTVLEGALEIRLGGETLRTGPGGVAHLPKTIPHALYNPLKTVSKYLALAIPGGMERFFDDLAAAQAAGTLDAAAHRNISLEYGIEWLE